MAENRSSGTTTKKKTTRRSKKKRKAAAPGSDDDKVDARQVDVAEVIDPAPAPGDDAADKKATPSETARGDGSTGQGATADSASTKAPKRRRRKRTPRKAEEGGDEGKTTESRAAADEAPAEKPRDDRASSRGGRGSSRDRRGSDRRERRSGKPATSRGAASSSSDGTREMLINVATGEECRIAVLHEGRLEELFIERTSTQSHVGNIYKGRVTNIEPSIQAAFVDFGLRQNGFLHISDVQPQYFPNHRGGGEDVGKKTPRHHRPPIQKCLRRGQEVIVQVTKEGVGTKGPTLTTYLSIPGRFLVMMPGMSKHGVSRKIEDEDERKTMRDLLKQLELPTGMGFIMRTAGLGRTKRELQRDLNYLQRLWKTVADRIKRSSGPAELYRESDLVTRTIRDVYTTDFSRVIVDDAGTSRQVEEFLRLALPRSKPVVELYEGPDPLFHRFGIEAEIEKINMRHVPLPSGGSIVIDATEALVAIDVNSGRFRTMDDAEETAFRINMEAVPEIARQLRLRDLGGLIVCDFIDMRADRHKRAVERALREELKKHKERARILRMSAFGIIEMTRQRQRPSIKRNIYFDCPQCKGAGVVKMPGSVVLDVMRILQLAAHRKEVDRISVTVSSDVADRLLNTKRSVISKLETETRKRIGIHADPKFTIDQVEYVCEDSRGRPVNVLPSYSGNE